MKLVRAIRRRKWAKLVPSLNSRWYQLPGQTSLDRYPAIFAAAAAAIPDARRVLSFGCSTGEECVSLANYFPSALVVGADVNLFSLAKAMKHRSDRIRFVYASDRILRKFGEFDAVFCMSVLRTPKADRVADSYPFAVFEERVLFLESLVRPGGLLAVHNGTYRLVDTAHRGKYMKIPAAPVIYNTVYLPDGVTEVEPDGSLYKKLDT